MLSYSDTPFASSSSLALSFSTTAQQVMPSSSLVLVSSATTSINASAFTYSSTTVASLSSLTVSLSTTAQQVALSASAPVLSYSSASVATSSSSIVSLSTTAQLTLGSAAPSATASTYVSSSSSATTSAVATPVNLIQNGDFESFSSQYCNSSWCVLNNTAAIAPWYIESGPTFELDKDPWKAYSGNWSMDLNSDAAFTLAQNISSPLQPGVVYQLSFQLRQNGCGPTTNKTGFISVTGSTAEIFYHDNLNASVWIPVVYQFNATVSNVTVRIGSTTPGSCGPVIDVVNLSPATSILTNATIPGPNSVGFARIANYKLYSFTKSGCEGKPPKIYCNGGRVLKNGSVRYGRWDNSVCPHSTVYSNTLPRWSVSSIPVRCIGLRSCQLNALNSEFGDPYGGTYKQFTANYTCA